MLSPYVRDAYDDENKRIPNLSLLFVHSTTYCNKVSRYLRLLCFDFLRVFLPIPRTVTLHILFNPELIFHIVCLKDLIHPFTRVQVQEF